MTPQVTAKPFTGYHMAAIFAGFFAVVFAANIVMAVAAFKSWTGLVVENSYVASQHFDEETALFKKSAAMGLNHKLHYGAGKLALTLLAKDGQPLEARLVMLDIISPANRGAELKLELLRSVAGRYELQTNLHAGAWVGSIAAKLPSGEDWKQPVRLLVEGQ